MLLFGQTPLSGNEIMAGLLGDIFSAGNVAKRKLTDLLGNPLLSAQQMLGNLNDRARVLNEMTAAAAREGVSYGPSSQQLAGLLSEAYNPVGMTTSRKKWTQQEIDAFNLEKRQREMEQIKQREVDRLKLKDIEKKWVSNLPNMGVGPNFTEDQLNEIAYYRLAGDRSGAMAEGASQTVNLLKNKIQDIGGKILSESKKDGGNSIYANIDGKVFRISDHELPQTPSRLHNREIGLTGKWDDEIITKDWLTTSLEDYLKIIKPNSGLLN